MFKEASYYYVDQIQLCRKSRFRWLDLANDVFRITVGTDITSIDDLRVKFKKHVHDGSYGESRFYWEPCWDLQ